MKYENFEKAKELKSNIDKIQDWIDDLDFEEVRIRTIDYEVPNLNILIDPRDVKNEQSKEKINQSFERQRRDMLATLEKEKERLLNELEEC